MFLKFIILWFLIPHVPQRFLRNQHIWGYFMPALSLLCPATSLVHWSSCTLAISGGQWRMLPPQVNVWAGLPALRAMEQRPESLSILRFWHFSCKEGKEISLLACLTEISSSKDKRYGGRRRRGLGDRQTGDSMGRRGHACLEGISSWRTVCNQYSTLLSWNLEQNPALARLYIPLQPTTALSSAGGDGIGLAVGQHKHWRMDIPCGFCSSLLATHPCSCQLPHPCWKLLRGPWGSEKWNYCWHVFWREKGKRGGGKGGGFIKILWNDREDTAENTNSIWEIPAPTQSPFHS